MLALNHWYLYGGVFGLLWLACLVSAGVLTWKNGHMVMFFVGFVLPILWIVGAIMTKKPPPYQPRVQTRASRPPRTHRTPGGRELVAVGVSYRAILA